MIISVDRIKKIEQFKSVDDEEIKEQLDALEILIRKYTNNNFQNRHVRFTASSINDKLNGISPFLKVGDTVQISQSKVNDGLYVVKKLNIDSIVVDKSLFTVNKNLVTKVEYPFDVKQGIINLMVWEIENRSKVGVKSETLSRHSVTYFDLDKTNQVMGYPVSLLGFLDKYIKARF
ncbi:MAG: hypothetical protein SPI74_05630 [Eubacterium sp.]|nr:hypothetical protein [Eubacterium sp.]